MRVVICAALGLLLMSPVAVFAQANNPVEVRLSNQLPAAAPILIPIRSRAMSESAVPIQGEIKLLVSLYPTEHLSLPVWSEEQVVNADDYGHYQTQVGAATPSGVPREIVRTHSSIWVGVSVNGLPEGGRVQVYGAAFAARASYADALEVIS